jgi:hypothetical protein
VAKNRLIKQLFNMKKDIINVVITFGLIAIVFTGGLFSYKEKIIKEQEIELAKYYRAEEQRVINEKLALIEQERILKIKQEKELARLRQIAIQEKATKKQVPAPTPAPISIPVPVSTPIPTPIPQPPVQVQAPTPTPVVKPTVTKPSRVSRAS